MKASTEKIQQATTFNARHWNEMNRKQRREMMRKIQSEDLSLEVVIQAAGIDIGNESHYVAVPTRDNNRCGASGALQLS